MRVTELLITGFDGDEAIFAVNLASATAAADSTRTHENGVSATNEASPNTTNAFEAIYTIVDRLPKISVTATS